MKPHNWGIDHLVLPDFKARPTEELQQFLQSFFILKLPNSYYYQIYICTFFVSLMLLSGFLIILKSNFEGKWWIFRNQRTSCSSRLYFIPNPTASFVFIEGLFFNFWLGYTYYSRAVDLNGYDGKYRGFLMISLWSLCWLGAWGGAIGTLYISPGILLRSEGPTTRFSIKRLVPSPLVVNILALGFPIIIVLGMLIGSILGGVEYSKAYKSWKSLDQILTSQSPTTSITSQQSIQALLIWKMFSESYFKLSIGVFSLTFGTVTLFVTYSGSAIYLIWTLRSQIKETEILFGKFKIPGTVSLNIEEVEERISVWTSVRARDREIAAAEEETRAAQSTFFPPIKGATAQLANSDSPEQRSKVLKEALTTIITLSLCINIATIIFIANTVYMAARYYESSLESPAAMIKMHEVYHLVAIWNSVIFGGLSFFLVLTRTYQTFFETSTPIQTKSNLSFIRSLSNLKSNIPFSILSSSSKNQKFSQEIELERSNLVVLGGENRSVQDNQYQSETMVSKMQ